MTPAAPSVAVQILGSSPALAAVRQRFQRVARAADVNVLVTGETGTGKELAARAIHEASPRAGRPFVALDCGTLPSTLIESELFGHKRGAFTGATEAHAGLFEAAHGGTLFLDEVGELSPDAQAKLLRVLETGEVRRVGETRTIKVDVRVLCATKRDLPAMVKAGAFRDDLFFRLAQYEVKLPALRDREGDAEQLAAHFLAARGLRLSDAARRAVAAYAWPGNVRELRHAMTFACVECEEGDVVDLAHLPPAVACAVPAAVVVAAPTPSALPVALPQTGTLAAQLATCERAIVERALAENQGNRTHTALALGVTRAGLHRIMARLDVKAPASVRARKVAPAVVSPAKVEPIAEPPQLPAPAVVATPECPATPADCETPPPAPVAAPAPAPVPPALPAIEVIDATQEPPLPTCAIVSAPISIEKPVPRAPSRPSITPVKLVSKSSPASAPPAKPPAIRVGDKLLRRGVPDLVFEAARFDANRPDAIGVRSPISSRIQFLPRVEFVRAPADRLR